VGGDRGEGNIPDSWVNKIKGQRERVSGQQRRTVAKYHQKRDMGVVWCGGQESKRKGEVKFGEKIPSQQRSRAGGQDKKRMCKGKT
jgi:hypothetical protein